MLLPTEHCFIAVSPEKPCQMLIVIMNRKATVRESNHPIRVRVPTGEQRRTTWRTRRRGAIGLAKQRALLGKTHQIWCRNTVAVWFDISASIMSVNVQDIHTTIPFSVIPP